MKNSSVVPMLGVQGSPDELDKDQESDSSSTSQTCVSPKLLGIFVIVVGLFSSIFSLLYILNKEKEESEEEFNVIIEEMVHNFQTQATNTLSYLTTISQHISVLSNPGVEDVFALANGILGIKSWLLGMSWAPLLRHSEREEWEAYISNKYNRTLFITEPDGSRRPNQSLYNPLSFMTTYDSIVILLDNFAVPVRKQLFNEAMVSGKHAISAPYHLFQFERTFPGAMHIYVPVYTCDTPELFKCSIPQTRDEREASMKGVVAAMLYIHNIANKVFTATPNSHYFDGYFMNENNIIMWSSNQDDVENGIDIPALIESNIGSNVKNKTIQFGSRKWFFVLVKKPEFDEMFYSTSGRLIPIVILVVSFTVSFLLFSSVFKNYKRQQRDLEIQRKVERHKQNLQRSAFHQFLECTSHDMRTPLQSAISALSLIMGSNATLDEDATQLLEIIQGSCAFVEMIMNNVMDIDKIEQNMLDIASEVTDLTGSIKELMLVIQQAIANAQGNIQLEEHIEDLPLLICDRSRVLRIVMNLISNSIKFTKQGKIVLRVMMVGRIKEEAGSMDQDKSKVLFSSHGNSNLSYAMFSNSGFSVANFSVAKSINDYASNIWTENSRISHKEAQNEFSYTSGTFRSKAMSYTSENTRQKPTHETVLVKFSVEDTGCGMTQEEIQNAVKPYTHAVLRNGGGSGLGLYITNSFVEAFGGKLEISSKVDSGTKIEFTLRFQVATPRQIEEYSGKLKGFKKIANSSNTSALTSESKTIESDAATKDDDPNSNSREQSAESKNEVELQRYIDPNDALYGLRVLLVEDNRLNLRLGLRILQNLGVDAEYAENGQMALYKMMSAITGTSDPFDAVLMDINMPVMDGITAVSKFREWEHTFWQEKTTQSHVPGLVAPVKTAAGLQQEGLVHPRLFICALTGNSTTDNITRCFQAGCDAFLPKPFRPSELESVLRLHIESGVVVPHKHVDGVEVRSVNDVPYMSSKKV